MRVPSAALALHEGRVHVERSQFHCDGSPPRGAANIDGPVLECVRHKKETTYPELTGSNARCRLVVLAGETGGRWSEGLLAKAKAREVEETRRAVMVVSMGFLLACASARAFAASLLDVRVSHQMARCPIVIRWFTTPATPLFSESGQVRFLI